MKLCNLPIIDSLFHNWTNWEDIKITSPETAKHYSGQRKICKTCALKSQDL